MRVVGWGERNRYVYEKGEERKLMEKAGTNGKDCENILVLCGDRRVGEIGTDTPIVL